MQAVIAHALRQRVLVIILGGGADDRRPVRLSARSTSRPIPTRCRRMVVIITQNPGQSPEEIERYITIPIEVAMAGLPLPHQCDPHQLAVRPVGRAGAVHLRRAATSRRSQLVLNRLAQLAALPNGVQPSISPPSPIGEILRYRAGRARPAIRVADLKTIQDWVLHRRFKRDPRRDRRHRLRRQDQDLRRRPSTSTGCWPMA